jgi:RIO kinase 1
MKRSFKKAAQYQEGRKVRNTRRARAMEKGSKFGRKQQEDAWQNTEVDALFKLAKAGVRVPEPYGCYEGVLLMELVTDDNGEVAPRLNDVSMSAEQAIEDHALVMIYTMRMLCVGLIHGDLSEFNVLVDDYGPVIIDLPQVVDAAANNNAFSMLQRDVRNMSEYYGQFAPELTRTFYAEEMWALFEAGELTPETELTGHYELPDDDADVDSVLEEIKAAFAEEQERIERVKEANEPL